MTVKNKVSDLTLDDVLIMVDEFVGYDPEVKYRLNGEIDSVEHLIAKNTWRKYVRLYNESNPDNMVIKIGNTKGTKYKYSDVARLLNEKYSRARIENLWFTKTQYVPKMDNTEKPEFVEQSLWDLFESEVPENKRIGQEDFMKLIKEARKTIIDGKSIAEIAKEVGEERIEKYKVKVPSVQYSDLSEIHKKQLLEIFDLDVYANLCTKLDSQLSRFDILFSIKKEVRNQIVKMEKNDVIDSILLASERIDNDNSDLFFNHDPLNLEEENLEYVDDGLLDEFKENRKLEDSTFINEDPKIDKEDYEYEYVYDELMEEFEKYGRLNISTFTNDNNGESADNKKES